MSSKKKKSKITYKEKLLIIITLAAISFSAALIFSDEKGLEIVENNFEMEFEIASLEDLSTEGFIEVEANAIVIEDRGLVSLEGGCWRMTAATDLAQAQSIRDAVDGVTGPRPNSHELMRDTFNILDIDVEMVKVTELKDNNFHGKIILKQDDTVISLDSRPSDGMAIALRTDSKIYFNETLLEEHAENIC